MSAVARFFHVLPNSSRSGCPHVLDVEVVADEAPDWGYYISAGRVWIIRPSRKDAKVVLRREIRIDSALQNELNDQAVREVR